MNIIKVSVAFGDNNYSYMYTCTASDKPKYKLILVTCIHLHTIARIMYDLKIRITSCPGSPLVYRGKGRWEGVGGGRGVGGRGGHLGKTELIA